MNDAFHQFFKFFEVGNLKSAINQILATPDINYDSLHSQESVFPFLVNYIDASVFGTYSAAVHANMVLLNFLNQDEYLRRRYIKALNILNFEKGVLELSTSSLSHQHSSIIPQGIKIPKTDSHLFENCVTRTINLLQSLEEFKISKNQLIKNYEENDIFASIPWYPLSYPLPIPANTNIESKHVPLIFIEPFDTDFCQFLNPLKNQPAVFAFETRTHLYQMLQFPQVIEAFKDSHHLLYVLDQYPNTQFAIQNFEIFNNCQFKPIFFFPRKKIETAFPLLSQALSECLSQTRNDLSSDSEAGNWLYRISKNLLYSMQQERYGLHRTAALYDRTNSLNLVDPHKGIPQLHKNIGPHSEKLLQRRFEEVSQKQLVTRKALPKKKLKVCHVVPQLVEGGHAPTKVLESFFQYYNQDRFELSLIITERLAFHPLEYPYNFYNSTPTIERAPEILNRLQSQNIKIAIGNPHRTFEQNGAETALLMCSDETDIVIYHGPDIINHFSGLLTDVPVRILLEHGAQPPFPGFDVIILSSHEAKEIYRDHYCKLKMKTFVLPFCVNVKSDWLAEPYSKTKLGFPHDALIMTTISHHLNTRLSDEMCLAIVEILKNVPKAYYAPIGPIRNEEKFRKFFSQHGVNDRIVFLGSKIDPGPSHFARTMQLYLNEFPLGSGFAILDAMASGCPVVTMYDDHGPQASRYGGTYFGIDRAITSGKREDYVNLACKLLTDPEMYREWSDHALKQYEKFSSPEKYVKSFEEMLEQIFSEAIAMKNEHE